MTDLRTSTEFNESNQAIEVHCAGNCGKEEFAHLKEKIPGVFILLPPDEWLWTCDGSKRMFMLICPQCTKRLHVHCECKEHVS